MTDARRVVLVTGGVRSGKSAHAESLLAAEPRVTYVAAGPAYDDADWQARIARHRERRPTSWATVETSDVAVALAEADGPVLLDCLGTWLDSVIAAAGWESPVEEVEEYVAARTTGLVAALRGATAPVVVVTNEVGLGVVPEHRSGRLFRDLLGTLNQRVAGVSDELHLVVAGRVLRL